jgi:hypothetical protein
LQARAQGETDAKIKQKTFMSVHLTTEQQERIQAIIHSGAYETVQDVVDRIAAVANVLWRVLTA